MPLTVEIIYRSFVLFTLLFLYTKLLKKKHLAEFRILDYMTSIVLGGIAAIHSSSLNLSLISGVVSMTTWFLLALLFQYLSYYFKTFQKLQGKQVIIIKDGKFIRNNMAKERYSTTEVLEDLRSKNILNVDHVQSALLEPSGRLNVLLKKDHRPLTKQSLANYFIKNPSVICKNDFSEQVVVSKSFNNNQTKNCTENLSRKVGKTSKNITLKNVSRTPLKTNPQLSLNYFLPDYYFHDRNH